MTTKFMYMLLPPVLLVASLLAHFEIAAAQKQQPLVMVMATAAGVSDVGSAQVHRVFRGYPTEYRPGKRLLAINHPVGTPDRTRFDRIVLGLSPDEVGRYWVDQIVRGVAQPPRILASAELALRVVASFPGAITYITQPSHVPAGLTVLTIDGKSATDPNYPLEQ